MSYCLVSDVQVYFQNTEFTTTSQITAEKVNSLIAMRSNYIDSILVRKYDLPLTEASDLAIIKSICVKLVAGDLDEITNFTVLNDNQRKGRNLKQEALDDLNKILDGSITLSKPLSRIDTVDIVRENRREEERREDEEEEDGNNENL